MKLWTINRLLRKIGLVLTLYSGTEEDGTIYHAFVLERASTYDKRVLSVTKTTKSISE